MTTFPVLVPVNRLERAKGRLADALSAEERQTLALITFETVLHACPGQAIVLTDDPVVAASAAGRARVLSETPSVKGLNSQLEAALAQLIADKTAKEGLLILHADLPLATNEAVETLFAASQPNSVVMVESADGGTNAMLLRRPEAFRLAYGKG